jgi:hypothetical protein
MNAVLAKATPGGNVAHAQFDSLRALLDAIEETARTQDTISIEDILHLVGRRWYGPLLFLAGLIMVAPLIGDIPGVPIMMGTVVILISLQLLWRRKRVWLPHWLRKRRLDSLKVITALRWFHRPARFIDGFTNARCEWAVRHAGLTIIALMCMMVGAITPVLELIPFSANLAGFAIATFGISVLAADGVVAFIAIAFSVATFGVGGFFLLGS